MARRFMAVGLTMGMGYASGVVALGGCASASWPSNGKLPPRVVDKLTDCGKRGPTPLEPVNYDLAFTVHVITDEEEARVDDVMLTDSTLHLHEVEACMADAFYGMRTPLEALALRQRKLAPDLNVAPEARAMFGQAEALLFLEFAIPIVIGYAVYRVVVHVLLDKPRPKHRPPPTVADTPAEPDATGMPMATSVPAATSAPATTVVPMATAVPKARRYPNQTCDDDMLDRLEGEKDKLCYPADGYAAICGGGTSKSKKPLIPCSAIKRGIEQRNLCLKQRSLVQKECFGGKPDAGHKTAIDLVENGIKACEALKLINCAKGHPMAGL